MKPPVDFDPRQHAPLVKCLSPRCRSVLTLLAEGLSSKEIARRRRLSRGTVQTYLKVTFAVLHVHCATQAVRVAVAAGLVK